MGQMINVYFSVFIAFMWASNMGFGQTHGKNGMVVSDNKIASQIGVDILQKGESLLPTF